MIDGYTVSTGDVLIGLASSGVHSNGFSLVRKVLLEDAEMSLHDEVASLNGTLGDTLLTPTRIYVKSLLELFKEFRPKGLVHVTAADSMIISLVFCQKGCKPILEKGHGLFFPIFHLIRRKVTFQILICSVLSIWESV